MANQPTFRYVNLTGGLATTRHPTVIAADQSPSVLNMQFDRGLPAKRRGYIKILNTAVKKSALDFAGSSLHYAIVPHCGTDLDIACNWTVEAVINRSPNNTETTQLTEIIFRKGEHDDSAPTNPGWGLEINESGSPQFVFVENDRTNVRTLNFGKVLARDSTYHLACVRQCTQVRSYINGSAGATLTVDNVATGQNKNPIIIGDSTGSGVSHYWGRLSEFRVWKTNRTATQLSNNKARELGATDTTNLAGYWKLKNPAGCFDSNADGGAWLHRSPSPPVWVDGLVQGAPTGSTQSGPRDFSLRFDGFEDYGKTPVPVPTGDPWDYYRGQASGRKKWTVEARVKPRCTPIGTESIDTILIYGSVAKPAFHLFTSNAFFIGKVEVSGGTEYALKSTTSAATGTARHLGLERSSSKLFLYVDGTKEASATIAGNNFGASIGNVAIIVGSKSSTAAGTDGAGFVGEIDEIRLWRVTRSTLLNTYKASDLPDVYDSNLTGYWKFNERRGTEVKDHSKSRANITLYPAANVPEWADGLVTPSSGPTIEAIFCYQKRGGLTL